MAQILTGSEVVKALDEEIISEVELLNKRGVTPTLAIIRVGERADDVAYERGAISRAEKLGVAVRSIVLPEDTTTGLLTQTVESLNSDSQIHGVLLFRPLPKHIDEGMLRSVLAPKKDVDGITDLSLCGVFTGLPTAFAPCTAEACMEILKHAALELRGKKAVVVGRSLVVGKPVAMLLLAQHATVTIAHSQTVNLPALVREADLVIACAGQARLIDGSCVSPGQVIIDVGINVAKDGSLVGDVAFEEVEPLVAAITPVPGGVGAVTNSVLVKHVVTAAFRLTSQ